MGGGGGKEGLELSWAMNDKFWSFVDKNGRIPEHRPELGPCWLWTGPIDAKGYGHFGGRSAHQYSLFGKSRKIPKGMHTDHLCRIRHCVRPSHLEVVTPRVNILRGEGPFAANARKLECKRGHPFTEENTWRNPETGVRECRVCDRIRSRIKRKRNFLRDREKNKLRHREYRRRLKGLAG
jgi:hypothetical protein